MYERCPTRESRRSQKRPQPNPDICSMVRRVEVLHRLIKHESSVALEKQGSLASTFMELVAPFLVASPEAFSRRDLLALNNSNPDLVKNLPSPCLAMSQDDFVGFINTDGPKLIDQYKDFKCRGYTGCGKITLEAMKLLTARGAGSGVVMEGIAHHCFSLVLVQGQPYWLDFTFDQFVDIQNIRNGNYVYSSDPIPYIGVLVLPVDRMNFKFDKQGRLLP